MNVLTSVSSTPPHTETARAAGQADDISQDLLEVVGGVAATVAGVVGAFSVGPSAVAALPAVVGAVAPIGGGTLLATALAAGPAAVGPLPAMACSPEIAKPGLHDLSITKVVDKASNPMMLMQAGAGLVPDGGLHPAVENAARLAFTAACDRTD